MNTLSRTPIEEFPSEIYSREIPKLAYGQLLADHLAVYTRIASGGYGDVYHAMDEDSGKNVALKVAKTPTPDDLGSFIVETVLTEILAKKTNDTVNFLGAGFDEVDSKPFAYMATEDIRGKTLAAKIIDDRKLGHEELVSTLLPVARAVSKMHELDLVHGDIKTNNILISESGKGVLVDFGASRIESLEPEALERCPVPPEFIPADAQRLEESQLFVSPGSIAPEVIMNESQPGSKSDVFQLGIVMYQAATGKLPEISIASQYGTFSGMRRNIRDIPPVTPKEFDNTRVSREVGMLIIACLGNDPASRPPAPEVVHKLQAA